VRLGEPHADLRVVTSRNQRNARADARVSGPRTPALWLLALPAAGTRIQVHWSGRWPNTSNTSFSLRPLVAPDVVPASLILLIAIERVPVDDPESATPLTVLVERPLPHGAQPTVPDTAARIALFTARHLLLLVLTPFAVLIAAGLVDPPLRRKLLAAEACSSSSTPSW
jgi:hypothetical protein